MGSSKKTTVGYWYPLAIRFGLGGAIDAFLQLRGGDRAAWQGELTSAGSINVDALELWGGEDGEGGMQGAVDIDFGTADQQPNAYCAGMFGPDSGYRGMSTVTWKGGKYGAFNPYPKPAAFLVRSILSGWADGDAWYAEKASIALNTLDDDLGPTSNGWRYLITSLSDSTDYSSEGFDDSAWSIGQMPFASAAGQPFAEENGFPAIMNTNWPTETAIWMRREFSLISSSSITLQVFIDNFAEVFVNGAKVLDTTDTTEQAVTFTVPADLLRAGSNLIVMRGRDDPAISSGDYSYAAFKVLSASQVIAAMNPAHVLYRRMRAKGEPLASINDASFRAAADVFYSESLGICTTYDHTSEDHDDFVARVCNVAGANLSRSRVNGQWYLDPVRGDYDIETLPVLTDADIIEWAEEPSVLDDAVNQVTVEWFDPASKESRTTSPVQSLGAIQSAGTINADTNSYPEVPSESLALRLAARDLQSTATPLRRFPLTCNRTPYAWRKGSRFRLQCPLRGIADMVCMVGEIDVGTLRSGSIAMTAVQDVFGMPETTYVVGEPGVDTSPDTTPAAAPAQRLMETTYRDLAQVLSAADLGALAPEAGYIALMAQRSGNALNYTLATAADGEEYAESALSDWCPVATVQDAAVAEIGPTPVVLIDGDELSWVVVGTAALWGDEIVRVDAIDPVTGAATLGRGCVDTVPADHAAGSRIWFYDGYAAADEREYISGETVHAKALTRTGSAKLALATAPASDLALHERAARPYPPGNLTVNGEVWPLNAWGALALTFADRDRLQEADKLIDTSVASIGPEAGTTYTVRWYLDGVLIQTDSGISSSGVTCSPASDGTVSVEVDALRNELTSWQTLRHSFGYTANETIAYVRITPSGDVRVTPAGDLRVVRLIPTT